MERKNGFLIIDDYKKLPSDDCISRGVYASCWLEDKDIYLFKHYGTLLSCYRELIYSFFATKIGILNVGYDLASYRGKKGVITKKCTKETPLSLKLFLLEHLKEQYTTLDEEIMYRKLFRVDTILSLLQNKYKENCAFIFKEVHKDLLIKFISSVLFANPDLNAKNLDFNESFCQFLPLYDFGSCGRGIDYNDFKGGENYFSLKWIGTEDIEEHPAVTLKNFLKCAEVWEVELFKEYLEYACTSSMKELQEEIENAIGIFLPEGAQSLKRDITKHLQATEKLC